MTDEVRGAIWVLAEQRGGRLLEVGLELLGKARQISKGPGWKVCAVLSGENVAPLAEELLAHGADEVLLLEHPLLESRCASVHVKALHSAMGDDPPEALLAGATAMGTEIVPRLAARLRTGLAAHCVDLELTPEGNLIALVPWPVGNLLGRIGFGEARPQMATVAPGIFPLPEKDAPGGEVVRMEVPLEEVDVECRVVAQREEVSERGGLEDADVIVAGGWGIGGREGWSLLERLAEALNGSVGATRPPVDEGWASPQQMIGTSGKTVSPRLYVGVALSGHLHHLVGIKAKELKVAINSDPNAPVFEHCDWGLVGDYRQILPKLIEAIRHLRQK